MMYDVVHTAVANHAMMHVVAVTPMVHVAAVRRRWRGRYGVGRLSHRRWRRSRNYRSRRRWRARARAEQSQDTGNENWPSTNNQETLPSLSGSTD